MVWIPLMFLALDNVAATGDLRWGLLGIVATAMHILSGHPQYVYYTGIVVGLYVLLQLIHSTHRLRLVGAFVGMYIGAVLLTAVQLFAGLQAASEQVRSGGTDFDFAAMFALPPQNLVTLVAPTFFGNVPLEQTPPILSWIRQGQSYWGTCYLWEVSLFVSVTGLALALVAMIRVPRRATWLPAVLVVVTIVFALGRHTPLYKPMFDFVPQYSSFRCTAKFTVLTALFLCLLAAYGFDGLVKNPLRTWVPACAIAALSIAQVILGITISHTDSWGNFVLWVRESAKISPTMQEWYCSFDLQDAWFQAETARSASTTCYIGALTLLIVAGLVWAIRFHRLVTYGLLGLAIIEMLIFASTTRATMDAANAYALPEPWKQPLENLPAGQRVLTPDTRFADLGMAAGYENLAGYDPGVLKRFAELMFASQNDSPAKASQYIQWKRPSPSVFRMYRCGLVCYDPQKPPIAVPNPLPLAVLVTDCVVLDSRDLILTYIARDSYDAATTVVLERPPGVQTMASASPPGKVQATRSSTDEIEINADLDRPAILVITENYSTGWRVVPIETSQPDYTIVPANWAQMAIALEKGRHRFTLEYSPRAFRIGAWVSIFALSTLGITSFLLMRRSLRFR
jgi:hypothetical protein